MKLLAEEECKNYDPLLVLIHLLPGGAGRKCGHSLVETVSANMTHIHAVGVIPHFATLDQSIRLE